MIIANLYGDYIKLGKNRAGVTLKYYSEIHSNQKKFTVEDYINDKVEDELIVCPECGKEFIKDYTIVHKEILNKDFFRPFKKFCSKKCYNNSIATNKRRLKKCMDIL